MPTVIAAGTPIWQREAQLSDYLFFVRLLGLGLGPYGVVVCIKQWGQAVAYYEQDRFHYGQVSLTYMFQSSS